MHAKSALVSTFNATSMPVSAHSNTCRLLAMRAVLTCTLLMCGFSAAFASSAPAAAPADASKGEILYNQGLPEKNIPACMSCHGANGHSGGGANPRLAGQHAGYIAKQLHEFKDPKKRFHAIMTPYAQALDEAQIQNIAAFLDKQTPKDNYKTKSALAPALGKSIYRAGIPSKNIPACAACHGPAAGGIPAQYPRLAGQSAEYVKAQLQSFVKVRHNNESMQTIASRMNDEEMQAVADYVSGLHRAQ